jgi:hypothetical protein
MGKTSPKNYSTGIHLTLERLQLRGQSQRKSQLVDALWIRARREPAIGSFPVRKHAIAVQKRTVVD